MTTRMVQIPEEEWDDLVSAASQLNGHIELPEPQPVTHIFQPLHYDSFGAPMCDYQSCGASRQNPIHYV